MGFCSKCGEIVGADQRCAACGYMGPATMPVSCGEAAASTKSDEFVPSGLTDEMTRLTIAALPPAPSAKAAPPFHRNESHCGLCSKIISGEAIALADGRLVHATCFSCSRCCVRMAPDGQGKYEYKASGMRVFCTDCAPTATSQDGYDVKDTSEQYAEAEWYCAQAGSNTARRGSASYALHPAPCPLPPAPRPGNNTTTSVMVSAPRAHSITSFCSFSLAPLTRRFRWRHE